MHAAASRIAGASHADRPVPQMHQRVIRDDRETTLLTAQQAPGESDDLPNLLLVAMLIHLFDVVTVAETTGLDEVQIALAEAALARVEADHVDARLANAQLGHASVTAK